MNTGDTEIPAKKIVTVELTEEDRFMILIALGFTAGATRERKDEVAAHYFKRSIEIANKLGRTYGDPK